MRRAVLLLALVLAVPLHAADVEAGAQHVMATPRGETGALDIPSSRGFGAHLEVFWSERISTRAAAVFLNPAVHLDGTDLGTLGLDVYSATARFHLGPRRGFSAFAGAGAALVQIGNLDDQFGDEIEIEFDTETAFVVEAGVRYRIHPRIVLEAGAAYVPLELEGPAPLPPDVAIDPLVISAGAAWRF
jgi:hypothetical protein